MKKLLTLIVAVALVALNVDGRIMRIHKSNGTSETMKVSEVTKITFEDDDDEHEKQHEIIGEWITEDSQIYYQFLSNGKGRYICLADEPGFNPEHPEAVIKHPVDPYDFDYKVEGDTLTMTEYYGEDKSEFTIYVELIVITGDVLQMKSLRWSEDGIKWNEESPDRTEWRTYNRWTVSK